MPQLLVHHPFPPKLVIFNTILNQRIGDFYAASAVYDVIRRG